VEDVEIVVTGQPGALPGGVEGVDRSGGGGDHDVELSVAVEVGSAGELSPEPCRYLGKARVDVGIVMHGTTLVSSPTLPRSSVTRRRKVTLKTCQLITSVTGR